MEEFWTWVWKYGYYKDEHALIRGRCREVCRFIALYDEKLSDVSGLREEEERCLKLEGSCHYVSNKGWVHSSYVPCDLGQCERTFGPGHVVDGGGDALEPYPMNSERTFGPSHVEDGRGDALQRISQDMDRSSPVQSERFRARDGPSQC
jgi:hypothetical protein